MAPVPKPGRGVADAYAEGDSIGPAGPGWVRMEGKGSFGSMGESFFRAIIMGLSKEDRQGRRGSGSQLGVTWH